MEVTTCDLTTESEISEIETVCLSVKDPLADVDATIETPKYYRLNEKIFAEPIANINENQNATDAATQEICFIDNVMVKKKVGKRHKYYIDVDRSSSNPMCPQTNCKKNFSSMILLRAHIRKVHCADRNKFICEHCADGFSAKYLLERHMLVHSREKVECPVCGKMLSRRTNMSMHLKWHSNSLEHACSECGRAFVRRATLHSHMRRVHARKQVSNAQCTKADVSTDTTNNRCPPQAELRFPAFLGWDIRVQL